MSYDTKCEELAQHFLGGEETDALKADVAELAQKIQDAIEEWFGLRAGD